MVRLARKARGLAPSDEAEAATMVAALAPEVRACLVSFRVRAGSVSRIDLRLIAPPDSGHRAGIAPSIRLFA